MTGCVSVSGVGVRLYRPNSPIFLS